MPDDNFTIATCVMGLAALLYLWYVEPSHAPAPPPSAVHPCTTVPV